MTILVFLVHGLIILEGTQSKKLNGYPCDAVYGFELVICWVVIIQAVFQLGTYSLHTLSAYIRKSIEERETFAENWLNLKSNYLLQKLQ